MAAIAELVLRGVDRTKSAFQSVRGNLINLQNTAAKATGVGFFGSASVAKLGALGLAIAAVGAAYRSALAEARSKKDFRFVSEEDIELADRYSASLTQLRGVIAAYGAAAVGKISNLVGFSGEEAMAEQKQIEERARLEEEHARTRAALDAARRARAEYEYKYLLSNEERLARKRAEFDRLSTPKQNKREDAEQITKRYAVLAEIAELEKEIAQEQARARAEQEKAAEEELRKVEQQAQQKREMEERAAGIKLSNLQRAIAQGEAVRARGPAAPTAPANQQDEMVRYLRGIYENLQVPK